MLSPVNINYSFHITNILSFISGWYEREYNKKNSSPTFPAYEILGRKKYIQKLL